MLKYVSSRVAPILGVDDSRDCKVKTSDFEAGREGTFATPEAGLLVAGDESEARDGPYFRLYVSRSGTLAYVLTFLFFPQRTTCLEYSVRGSL
jgi:hypothetical protein